MYFFLVKFNFYFSFSEYTARAFRRIHLNIAGIIQLLSGFTNLKTTSRLNKKEQHANMQKMQYKECV